MEQTSLIAFDGSEALRERVISDLVVWRIKQNEAQNANLVDAIGIPPQLKAIAGEICKNLPEDIQFQWLLSFIHALPIGKDTSKIHVHWMIWMLEDQYQYTVNFPDCTAAIKGTVNVYKEYFLKANSAASYSAAGAADAARAARAAGAASYSAASYSAARAASWQKMADKLIEFASQA